MRKGAPQGALFCIIGQLLPMARRKTTEGVANCIPEQRPGTSSLNLHGAHEVAKYMPQGTQDVGHHDASQRQSVRIEAQNAGVTGDLKALSNVTAAYVGCHAAYRLQ